MGEGNGSNGYQRVVILDTSFLIAYAQGHHWTIAPFNLLAIQDSMVIIPQGVENEYARIMSNGKPKLQQASNEANDVFELIRGQRCYTYLDGLREVFAQKLDRDIAYLNHRHSPLSIVDKTIVQAAYDMSLEGMSVSVASADRGIIDQTENVNLEHNISIDRHSPWRPPTQHEGLEFLVTDSVFKQLKFLPQDDLHPRYLAVAKNFHIGNGVKYDVAFAVYVNMNSSIILPKLNGAYFIRIWPASVVNAVEQPSLLTFGIVAAYPADVSSIALVKNMKPLTRHEAWQIISKRTARKLTPQDLARLKAASSNFQEIDWARISEEDIGRHDRVTEGKLDELTDRLDEQMPIIRS